MIYLIFKTTHRVFLSATQFSTYLLMNKPVIESTPFVVVHTATGDIGDGQIDLIQTEILGR